MRQTTVILSKNNIARNEWTIHVHTTGTPAIILDGTAIAYDVHNGEDQRMAIIAQWGVATGETIPGSVEDLINDALTALKEIESGAQDLGSYLFVPGQPAGDLRYIKGT